MAKDGLIFRFFATMNNRGVPACANFWLSLIAACCALYFSLEVLVEMMSIGTLLAYTLVDACVLILRYQHSRQQRSQPAFIELLQAPEAEKLARPNSQMEIMSPMDEFTQNVELGKLWCHKWCHKFRNMALLWQIEKCDKTPSSDYYYTYRIRIRLLWVFQETDEWYTFNSNGTKWCTNFQQESQNGFKLVLLIFDLYW